ncbi:MAG: DegT/DnrJ/EryC1/StrS family aminotransferase, partial [Elusimicrobia bacterium]|nr:DegT/DnrJ/EryC1/StrS family aminotransferase [Elusimicrobiota bacterium]
EEIDEVVRTIRSGWLTTGPQARRFEAEFAAYLGRRHAVAVNSATAGLHLALEAIGVGPGDVVITTVFTFTATAEVIRYLNATPVFIDINPKTKNMDVQALKAALHRHAGRVKAVIPVHFAGLACEMGEILECAKKSGAVVVEDAAHALPTRSAGRLIGSFGDITVFSFYATKTLATGEGGMIVTDDDRWAERMRVMRLHGISKDAFGRYSDQKPSWHYEVVAPGYKYNLTDVAAALGIQQLRKVEAMHERRVEIAAAYLAGLASLPLELPYSDGLASHAWHLFTIELLLDRIDIGRDEFIGELMKAGVGVSVHFIPLNRHPYWRQSCGLDDQDFPVATDKFLRTVSLPIYPRMTKAHVERVIGAVAGLCERHAVAA